MQVQQISPAQEINQKGEPSRLEELIESYRDPVKALVHEFLEGLVRAEFETFIGPRIGQIVQHDENGRPVVDYRNGQRILRQVMVDTMALADFRVPRNRAGGFRTTILERSRRRAGRLAEVAKELFVHGLGTRRIRRAFERTGVRISGLSKSTVSRISKELMQEYLKWSNRPIKEKYSYLLADAVYIRVRQKSPRKPGTLMFVGIRADGKKEVLHFTLGTESERNFDEALQSLLRRGLDPDDVKLITLDGAAGPLKSAGSIFGEDKIQRCTFHKLLNILEKAPAALREELKAKIARLWNQPSRLEADRYLQQLIEEYEQLAPAAIRCLTEDVDSLFRFFDFPDSHRKSIRTTNLIERVIREVRRRTKVMDSLDSEKGVYGIVMGIVREQNERWARKSHWKKEG